MVLEASGRQEGFGTFWTSRIPKAMDHISFGHYFEIRSTVLASLEVQVAGHLEFGSMKDGGSRKNHQLESGC